MNRRFLGRLPALTFCCVAAGQAWADQAEDEAAIRKTVDSYAAAFNQRDVKALAAHWLPEAVHIDPDTGKKVVSRAAIEKHFAETFSNGKNVK